MADYCEHLGCGGQCMAHSGAIGWGHITVGCEYVNRNGDPSAARQRGCPDYKRPKKPRK